MMNQDPNKKVSVITEETVINGDVSTSSALIVLGTVSGNVTSSDDVEVRGVVNGEIKANNVNVSHSSLQGNVTCTGNLYVDKDSSIEGNISCNQVKLAGRIKGQIDVKRTVEFLNNSVVEGDVFAESIAIEHGAVIQGYVNIKGRASAEPKPVTFPKVEAVEGTSGEFEEIA